MNLLKDKGITRFRISQLDTMMKNMGNVQFSYDVLIAAKEQDPKIDSLIKNIDRSTDTVELKTREIDDLEKAKPSAKNKVANMAKKAVDLKDL